MTTIMPPPARLVDSNGKVSLGIFSDSIATINGRSADYRTPLGDRANRIQRHVNYKQFQYFGLISDELLIGCALADTAWLGIAFFYIFEPRSGRLQEYTWRSPLARALQLSDSPVQGQSRYRQKGVDIAMGYQQTSEGLRKTLKVTLPGIQLDLEMLEDRDYQPMSLCTRAGINGWVYANKVAGVPVTGTLLRDGQRTELAALDAYGHHDFSAGYMRRETFWNWACLSGRCNDHQLGLNLSCGVNETSYSENCLWLDGQRIAVAGTTFEYDQDNIMSAWRVRSECGQVDLQFTPAGRHRERLDLGVFASNFNQLFGSFNGTLALHDGRRFNIEHCHGFVEEQYAKW